MRAKSINKSEILALHNFLMDAIHYFITLNCQSDELIISLPNWLQQLLRSYPMVSHLDDNLKMILEHLKYFDVKIQPHYTDEVVVFFKDYHIHPEKLAPKIHTINFEDEENRKES